MCPFCLASVVAIVAGLGSLGGVGAAAIVKREPTPATAKKTSQENIGRRAEGSR